MKGLRFPDVLTSMASFAPKCKFFNSALSSAKWRSVNKELANLQLDWKNEVIRNRTAERRDLTDLAHHRLPEFLRNLGSLEQLVPFIRSEEHTSELQSLRHLVCRLL